MTPKEQRYLFIAVWLTVQGLFLIVGTTYAFFKSEVDEKGEPNRWGVAFALLFLAKLLNSYFCLTHWGNFLDPDGA